MRRLHVHVAVNDIERAVGFYSRLFDIKPCCGGPTYANWRVDEPPLNFAASVGDGARGAVHFGLEVDTSTDLQRVDRALQKAPRSSSPVRWEVSVRKPVIRKEPAS